jgi:hypothetical protein
MKLHVTASKLFVLAHLAVQYLSFNGDVGSLGFAEQAHS